MILLDKKDDHYSSVAERYARYRPAYPRELFRYLASLTCDHDLAIDCACGSGQASHLLADYYAKVIGVDRSQEQLGQAEKMHSHPRIIYKQAAAEVVGKANNLDDGSVDLVTVATAFHWLNKEQFCKEVYNILKPHGILALWTYTSSVFTVDDQKFKPVIDAFVNKITSSWPKKHHESAAPTGNLPAPFDNVFGCIAPPAIVMQAQRNLDQFLGYIRTWSAIPHYIEQHGKDPVEDLKKEIAPLWGNPANCYSASQPLFLNVFRKAASTRDNFILAV